MSKIFFWSALLVAFIIVLAPGCERATTVEGFNEEYLAAHCHRQVECGWQADMESCEQAYAPLLAMTLGAPNLPLEHLLASLDAGFLEFDSQSAGLCLEKLWGTRCEKFDEVSEICRSTFTGNVPEGEPCLYSLECGDLGICRKTDCGDDMCCEGICRRRSDVLAGPGESCDDRSCDGSVSYCGGDAICRALGDAGDSCQWDHDCRGRAICSRSEDEELGECVERVPVPEGADCGDPTYICDRFDLWCNPQTDLCERRIEVGESCSVSPNGCVQYAYCRLDEMICVMRPLPGDPCPDGFPYCGRLECDEDRICRPAPKPEICER